VLRDHVVVDLKKQLENALLVNQDHMKVVHENLSEVREQLQEKRTEEDRQRSIKIEELTNGLLKTSSQVATLDEKLRQKELELEGLSAELQTVAFCALCSSLSEDKGSVVRRKH
jgi:hypothetical protein